mmetsp:Transcript_47060/g.87409  ORF Transcript_47060/g.87409 Transcript_47060/m.87409 type:complete len:215 (-) Transcript_47060:49-693(-)
MNSERKKTKTQPKSIAASESLFSNSSATGVCNHKLSCPHLFPTSRLGQGKSAMSLKRRDTTLPHPCLLVQIRIHSTENKHAKRKQTKKGNATRQPTPTHRRGPILLLRLLRDLVPTPPPRIKIVLSIRSHKCPVAFIHLPVFAVIVPPAVSVRSDQGPVHQGDSVCVVAITEPFLAITLPARIIVTARGGSLIDSQRRSRQPRVVARDDLAGSL